VKEFRGKIILLSHYSDTSKFLNRFNKNNVVLLDSSNQTEEKINSILLITDSNKQAFSFDKSVDYSLFRAGDMIPIYRKNYFYLIGLAKLKSTDTKIDSIKGYKSNIAKEGFFITFECRLLPGTWKILSEKDELIIQKIQ
jgi:hypothetical protein